MRPPFAVILTQLVIGVLAVPLATFASGTPGRPASEVSSCVRSQIFDRLDYAKTRPKQVLSRYSKIKKACAAGSLAICNDPSLSPIMREYLLRASAHLDDPRIRATFHQSFPPKSRADLERLYRYAVKRLGFCDPPVHETCSAERWEMVFEDYLTRSGKLPGGKYLSRWSEDHIEQRIPGLEDFLKESPPYRESPLSLKAYETMLNSPGLSADSISIVSEQAMKKRLNDVNKGLSDVLGDIRLRYFRWHLEQALSDEGLSVPKAARVDFKTDRLLEPLRAFEEDHPIKFEHAVNRAAAEANADIVFAIQTRFPELMYVTDLYDPAHWFNTASFSLPGYSPRLNEALASFKARQMRSGFRLTNEEARDQFVTHARQVIQFGDDLKRLDSSSGGLLLRAGVIGRNGLFTQKTAKLIRKVKQEDKLSAAIANVFQVKLTDHEEELLLQQWHAQDMLSLPLLTMDQMGPIPKGTAILGGDGIGGGAIDASTKVNALFDHRGRILKGTDPDAQVKLIFNALVEADTNASAMIRSAPVLLKRAVESMPAARLKKAGLKGILTSADDAVIPLENLMKLSPVEREQFYRGLVRNVSASSQRVQISSQRRKTEISIGPEILRAFLGHDKASAEAAEHFLKPFEERLESAQGLGPHWRDLYPDVAFLSVCEGEESFKVYVAGKSLNSALKSKLEQALHAVERGKSHVEIEFVE